MNNTSYIEISKKAYISNIKFIRKIVGPSVRISSVIKGNAYGHGVEIIIPLAETCGINHFSVFSSFEARQAYEIKDIMSDIMIFGYIADEDLEWVVKNGVEFYIFDKTRLGEAIELAKKHKTKARIHLEIETGFKRTGLEKEDLPEIVKLIKNNINYLIIKGLATHYAGAESIANYVRIQSQLSMFRKYCQYFKRHGLSPEYRHTASSAASLLYPQTIYDLVRIGIAQYGFWPTVETLIHRHNKFGDKESSLKRVISWKSKIMSIKNVKSGEYVGYGSSYLANKDMKIAIIPVGYNNGFDRSLSNKGRVLINGRRLDVIGTVTMNTITVNISDLKNVKIGDEVVLIGKQKKLSISVASFSEMSDKLNYQVLARLPLNIPRILCE